MTTLQRPGTDRIAIRRTLRDGDADAIAELHRRVYEREYGLNEQFTASVKEGVEAAAATGWPRRSGALWLVERGGGPLLGALALTDEGNGLGRVRWFVLDPGLRGRGLGRSLMAELLDEARAAGLRKLELETINLLTAAARIYRDAGFRVAWERERDDWGPRVTYQGYRADLG
jgi:ribosomal protein S18 acetylase RimI-like enzyme